jgi:hypothetical protein
MRLIMTATAFLVLAASPVVAAEPPERTTALVVFGNDPCPRADRDEIVVCARKPESERYRIPKALREKRRSDGESSSWAAQWSSMEDGTRYTRPNSCSPVGTGGQTGCTQAMLRRWFEERQAAARAEP